MRIEYIKSHLDIMYLPSNEEVLEHLHTVLPLDYRAIDVAIAYGKYFNEMSNKHELKVDELVERINKLQHTLLKSLLTTQKD